MTQVTNTRSHDKARDYAISADSSWVFSVKNWLIPPLPFGSFANVLHWKLINERIARFARIRQKSICITERSRKSLIFRYVHVWVLAFGPRKRERRGKKSADEQSQRKWNTKQHWRRSLEKEMLNLIKMYGWKWFRWKFVPRQSLLLVLRSIIKRINISDMRCGVGFEGEWSCYGMWCFDKIRTEKQY